MVTFYAGNTLRGIAEKVLASLPEDGQGKHVILVPDRDTLAVEEAVTRKYGATVNIEVLTFARLATRILGNAAYDCLTPEGCTMLLTKALYRVKDRLIYYRNACGLPGFANEMYSALVSIRESGVTAEMLSNAADRSRGRTKDKMRDIALIYAEYLSVLSEQMDPTSRLQKTAAAIPAGDEVGSTTYYVIDFYCFNQVQYEVISALMAYAKEVHIGFIAEHVGKSNRRIYPMDMREKLLRFAKEKGLFCRTVSAYEPLTSKKEILQEALFGYDKASVFERRTGAEELASISLFRTQDATSELREVCSEIAKSVRNGMRYRDIAIVCAQGDLYEDIFRAVFQEYDIPYFRDTKVLLSEEPAVRFILDTLDAERQNMAFESVMKVVKNAFFSEDVDDVHYFENYCRKYGIDYSRFLQPFTLADEGDDLERAETCRKALVAGLPDMDGCKTVGEHVRALQAFLAEYDMDGKFAAFRNKQVALGFKEGAKRSEQVPKRLREMLDLTLRLLGDEPADLERFVMLTRSSLDSVRISLLPQSADCVYIGEAKDSRYDRVKVMFVVGAADGVLPEVPKAGSILSDAFHSALQAQNIVIYPSDKEQGKYAMFYLEQLLLLPTERLYVSFCTRSTANEERYPSVLVESLAQLFGLTVTDGLGHTVSEQIGNKKNAYKVLLRARKDIKEEDVRTLYWCMREEDRARYDALFEQSRQPLADADGLFFAKDLTSISQLETYFLCPYLHFVRYGLRAKEREEDLLDVRETGSLLHAVLELFFKRNYMRIDELTTDEVDEEVDACLKEVLANARYEGLKASERRVQLERLGKESHIVVAREVRMAQQSLFKPREFEVSFGDGREYPAIDLQNGIRLRGKIDRIDRCDDALLVIDYKTGGSININLSEVYFGAKVQLYAYLGALQKAGYVPIGAFYKQVSGAYERSDSKIPAGTMRGHPPQDEAILCKIDPKLQSAEKSELLTVAKEKGVWKNREEGGTLLEKEQLQDIIDYVLRLMQRAVDEIREGYKEAKPLNEHVCKFCAVKYMCDNINRTVREEQAVKITSFGREYE